MVNVTKKKSIHLFTHCWIRCHTCTAHSQRERGNTHARTHTQHTAHTITQWECTCTVDWIENNFQTNAIVDTIGYNYSWCRILTASCTYAGQTPVYVSLRSYLHRILLSGQLQLTKSCQNSHDICNPKITICINFGTGCTMIIRIDVCPSLLLLLFPDVRSSVATSSRRSPGRHCDFDETRPLPPQATQR